MKTRLEQFGLNLPTVDLEVIAIDLLSELLDRATIEADDKLFLRIDKACKKRVSEYNKDFGTNYSSIYQVLQHYKSL